MKFDVVSHPILKNFSPKISKFLGIIMEFFEFIRIFILDQTISHTKMERFFLEKE